MHSAPSAVTLSVILAAFSVFQLALLFGAPIGAYAFGGKSARISGTQRLVSLGAIVISIVAALVALGTAGVIGDSVRSSGFVAVMWIFAAAALLLMLSKVKSESKAERTVMAPLSAAAFALALVVAFGP